MMVESELLQFQFIMDHRTAGRIELDRVLIRGQAPERYQAVRTYVQVLDQCIAELKAWTTSVRSRIDRACQAEAVPTDDLFCTFLRISGIGLWITSLRQERKVLAGELASIDELNAAQHERDEPINGTAPNL